MISAFLKFFFSRTESNYRELRRVCRAALPKQARKAMQEAGE